MDSGTIGSWTEHEIAQLLGTLILLGAMIWLLVVLIRLNRRIRCASRTGRLTKEQQQAERSAIEKLILARRLLMESDENVEEAQRLRDEVMLHDLPKHRMYIPAKDPNSLLLDVDKRIQVARMRLQREE